MNQGIWLILLLFVFVLFADFAELLDYLALELACLLAFFLYTLVSGLTVMAFGNQGYALSRTSCAPSLSLFLGWSPLVGTASIPLLHMWT